MNITHKSASTRIKEITYLSDKTTELIKQKKIEEAYHSLFHLNTLMTSSDLSDSERVIVLYTQAVYFNYYNQLEKVEQCCKEIIKLTPYSEDSFIYFSMACLLFSKIIYEKNNYVEALKIAETGFKYLQICKDSESSFELLKNYKEFVDFIEKNSENRENLIKPVKSPANSKIRGRFSSMPHKKPLLTPITHKTPLKPVQFSIKSSLLHERFPNTLEVIHHKANKRSITRNYFNKSVQHRRRLSEPEKTQFLSDVFRVLISKQRISSLKASKSSIIKALNLLDILRSESGRIKGNSVRVSSSLLPTIPEIT